MDNNFKEIKFCNRYASLLTNNKMAASITKKLTRYYKVDLTRAYSKYFKFADTTDFKYLSRQPHLAYFNFKEQYSYLYLTIYNGINFCFYLTNNQIISVKHRFSDILFKQDTLFEGKLVKGKSNRHYFLVSDLIIHENHTFFTDLVRKLRVINTILMDQHQPDPVLDPCCIKLQDFVEYQYLESFIGKYLKKIDYRPDGLIFRPVQAKDTKNMVFLFKPRFHKNLRVPHIRAETRSDIKTYSIDRQLLPSETDKVCFKLKKTRKPDVYELYLTDGKNDCYCDIAHVPDIGSSHQIRKLFPAKYHYIIASCKWNEPFKRWVPYRRSNRNKPDSVHLFGRQ